MVVFSSRKPFLDISNILAILGLSVENPNKLLTVGEYRKALNSGEIIVDLIACKITQAESQMVDSILKVLQAIDTFGKLNTTSILTCTGLYPNTVRRVMNLLMKKNIVHLQTREDRKNNEKIYSLKRTRAIIYINHIISQKNKIYLIFKKIADHENRTGKLFQSLGDEFTEKEIMIPEDLQKKYNKKYKNPISINDLPYLLGKEIIYKYTNNYFCHYCFDDGTISNLEVIDDVEICKKCGREIPYESRYPLSFSKNYVSYRKKQIDNQISLVKKGIGVDNAIKKSQRRES